MNILLLDILGLEYFQLIAPPSIVAELFLKVLLLFNVKLHLDN